METGGSGHPTQLLPSYQLPTSVTATTDICCSVESTANVHSAMGSAPIFFNCADGVIVVFDLPSFISGDADSAHRVVASPPRDAREFDTASLRSGLAGAADGPIINSLKKADGPEASSTLVLVAELNVRGTRKALLAQYGWPGPIVILYEANYTVRRAGKWEPARKSLYRQACRLRASGSGYAYVALDDDIVLRFPTTGPPCSWPLNAGRRGDAPSVLQLRDARVVLRRRLRAAHAVVLPAEASCSGQVPSDARINTAIGLPSSNAYDVVTGDGANTHEHIYPACADVTCAPATAASFSCEANDALDFGAVPCASLIAPTCGADRSAPILLDEVDNGFVTFDLGSFVSGVDDRAHRVVSSRPLHARSLDSNSVRAAMNGAAVGPIIDAETIAGGPDSGTALVLVAAVLMDRTRGAALVQYGWPGPLLIVYYPKRHLPNSSAWGSVGLALYMQVKAFTRAVTLRDVQLSRDIVLRYPTAGPPSFWPKRRGPRCDVSNLAMLRELLAATSESVLSIGQPIPPSIVLDAQSCLLDRQAPADTSVSACCSHVYSDTQIEYREEVDPTMHEERFDGTGLMFDVGGSRAHFAETGTVSHTQSAPHHLQSSSSLISAAADAPYNAVHADRSLASPTLAQHAPCVLEGLSDSSVCRGAEGVIMVLTSDSTACAVPSVTLQQRALLHIGDMVTAATVAAVQNWSTVSTGSL